MNYKTLITEGRYDSITRKIVKDIISILKSELTILDDNETSVLNLPSDINDTIFYAQKDLFFNVDLELTLYPKLDRNFVIKSFLLDPTDNGEETILIQIFLKNEFILRDNLNLIYYKLTEDVRHEIEHITQVGIYRISDRPNLVNNTAKVNSYFNHHMDIIEIPALAHGFYLRAKKERKPFSLVVKRELNQEVDDGHLTKRESDIIYRQILKYSKKRLPDSF